MRFDELAFHDLVVGILGQPDGQKLIDQLVLRECCMSVSRDDSDASLRHQEGRRELAIELANIARGITHENPQELDQ